MLQAILQSGEFQACVLMVGFFTAAFVIWTLLERVDFPDPFGDDDVRR